MKKIVIYSELAFIIAIVTLATGMNFIILSNFGISSVQSVAYVLSLAIPKISFGTFNYLLQLLLVLILCIIIKKFRIKYIFCFLSAVLYGFTVDFFTKFMSPLYTDILFIRIIYYIVGFFLIVFAVCMFFRTNIPLMPYDIFVTDLSRNKNLNLGTVKIIFDISFLFLGIAISLIIFHRLEGIGIGTIVSGLLSGISIKFTGKQLDKIIEYRPIFKSIKY